jgi:hypothetical protein
MNMLNIVTRWLEKRRQRRRVIAADTQRLLSVSDPTAYYDAHRFATRARMAGDVGGFTHWVRVAAEIARTSDAPMEIAVMRATVEDEERRARQNSN